MVSDVIQDARYALRQLRRSPGYALTVGLTVALAVASVATLASVLQATLWSRLPYADAGRLMVLRDHNLRQTDGTCGLMSVLRFADVQALQHDGKPLLASIAHFYLNPTGIAGTGQEAHAVNQAGVSERFFDTLDTPPLLGRTLRAEDGVQGAPARAVISYGLWQSLFAGDPRIVGRSVRLGDGQATIVGVMEQRFAMPAGVDVWVPGHIQPALFGSYRGEGSRFLNVVARMQPGDSVASVQAGLQSLSDRLANKYPASDAAYGFASEPLRENLFGSYRRALLLLSAAVAILLLVVVLNLSTLQVTRGVARQPEFAIRAALGVTGERLLRQLVTENLVLLLMAAGAGLGLAVLFLRLLLTRIPAGLLVVDTPHLNFRVVGLVVLLSALISSATATASWRLSRRGSSSEAGLAGARVVSARSMRLGRVLAVAQIASAFVLLTLSVSVVSELYRLMRTPLGFTTEHVQTFTVDKGWNADTTKLHAFYQGVEQRVSALPGVRAAGAMSSLPLQAFSVRRNFDVQGRPLTPKHDTLSAQTRLVSHGLLSSLEVPLLAGRPFGEHDGDAHAPERVLVNRTLAERYFGGVAAVGQKLLAPGGVQEQALVPTEIVGVVGDVRGTEGPIAAAAGPEVYFPENGGWPHMQFAVRTDGDLPGLESQVRQIVTGMDPAASVGKFTSIRQTLKAVQQQPELNAQLLTLFAGFGTLLVMIGVYGLAAFNLSQRMREFAVRIALGSSREAVLRLMLRDVVRVLAVGVPIGAVGVLLATRLARATVLSAESTLPLWTYAVTAALLVLCALVATWQPARRAALVDPMEALRAE